MRQKEKKRVRDSVIALVLLLLLLSGCGCYIAFRYIEGVRAEYEDIEFAGGEAIDLTALDEAKLDKVKKAVVSNAAGMAMKFVMRPGVLADIMALIE